MQQNFREKLTANFVIFFLKGLHFLQQHGTISGDGFT